MRLFFFVSGFWLIVSGLKAQSIKPDRAHHHFGVLNEKSEFFTDFVFTNKTGKKAYFFRAEADREISWRISNKTIMPDSSVTLRVQYNPAETGKFSEQIEVHLSSNADPVILSVSGETVSVPHSGTTTDCPDFSSIKEVSREMEFQLKIKVIDKLSGEPIEKAQVKIIYKGLPKYIFETPQNGTLLKKIPLGYYYFVTTASEYITNEFDAYVNVRNNELLIELTPIVKIHADPLVEYEEVIFSENTNELLSKDTVRTDPDIRQDDVIVINENSLVKADSTFNLQPSTKTDTVSFNNEIYLHNNIVFLIDISSSMMDDGKLDLLKASMIELAQMLRPVDKIAIVVYSTHARIALSPVTGDKKEEVIKMIQDLEGDGLTAGAEGMKKAYELAATNFIPGGNNMVIMATDGAFNLYTTDVVPMVKKYFKKGINTSVVGIKNSERDAKNMVEIANQGKGRYMAINNLEEAMNSLTEEVKIASRKE